MIAFDAACTLLERALAGGARRRILESLRHAASLRASLTHLGDRMRRHDWATPGMALTLDRLVGEYDRRTRTEGLHALHDWDGKADRVNDDSIPLDVLNFLIERRGTEPADPHVAAILIDYYFLYVLALLSLRVWDQGDADANLDRLDGLLQSLQGPDGSGQQFAADAETLILIATSHFELEERGYHLLLERVRTLNRRHRTRIAVGHAAAMGSHLRFGFEATYGRDTAAMRQDNVADYPWLCFTLATLMREYTRLRAEENATDGCRLILEALLNGLSPDARAFVGEAPGSLAACREERDEFRDSFRRYRADLLDAFERLRPTEHVFSPLSFFFNFSQNVVKGTVVDALLRGRRWRLALNDLMTSEPRGSEPDTQLALATTLMGYARGAPDIIRHRPMPVIVYDPGAGRQAFTATMRKLRD